MTAADSKGLTLTNDDFAAIAGAFGHHYINSYSHRKICCLETNAGYKYLKKTSLAPQDLRFIHEALLHLDQRGFQTAPVLDCSNNDEPYVIYKSNTYIMTNWYFSQELDFDSVTDLSQATRFLAKFHNESIGFLPSHEVTERTLWLKWPQLLNQRIKQLSVFRQLASQEKESSEFSRLYLQHFEPFYRQALASLEALRQSAYYEMAYEAAIYRQFCHHDYSGRNILRTQDLRLILVDFDYCLLDLRIHDLINLLVRNLKHNQWQFDLGRFILSEYNVISPLKKTELEVMYILLCWPQEFWQVGLQYYEEKLPWSKERFIKKLRHKIDYQHQRLRFLDKFPKDNGLFDISANPK